MAKFVVVTENVSRTAELIEAENETDARNYHGDVLETARNEKNSVTVQLYNDGFIKEEDLKTVEANTFIKDAAKSTGA